MLIRKAKNDDTLGIYELYLKVAEAHPTKLTQNKNEITKKYIEDEVIQKALKFGLILVAEDYNHKIIGMFKSYTSPYQTLAHIMTNTTLISTPEKIGKKIFILLYKKFFEIIKKDYKHIYKIEASPHLSNSVVIKFYTTHNMHKDAVLKNKIFNIKTNSFEDEVIVSWINPNFDMIELEKYHKYLANLF